MVLPPLPHPAAEAALAAEDHLSTRSQGLGSLGRLGALASWWCGVRGSFPASPPERARLVIFAADHGVRHAGVTGRDPDSGGRLVAEIVTGNALIVPIAASLGVGVEVVDVGLAGPEVAGVVRRRVRAGTGDLRLGPAMLREEAERAVQVGMEVATAAVEAGADVLVAGELAIAGSTSAAAVLSAIAATPGKLTAGRGAGLDDAGVARKVRIIDTALSRERPDRGDTLGILAAVGGLEIAAIAGFCLGAASRRVPVLLDGLCSTAGGLVASGLDPAVLPWLLVPHQSPENAHWAACRLLGHEPPLELRVCEGEGTGAVFGVALLKAAASLVTPGVVAR